LSPEDGRLGLAAALVHDLGHGPLSHLFEEVFEHAPPHEAWTSALVLDPDSEVHQALREFDPELPEAVERLVHGEHPLDYLAHAVSGTFDVDRCDYLLRDSYMTGARYGLYDLDWLLRSLRLVPVSSGDARLAVDGSKGLPAVEGFFLARLFMYQQVYFHKAARAAEWMVRGLFARLVDLVRDGRVPDGLPPPLVAMARGQTVSPSAYCSLDDGTVWHAAEQWERGPDPVLSDLSQRLRARALFKTATVDDEHAPRAAELVSAVRDLVARAGLDPRYYVALDAPSMEPYEPEAGPESSLQVVYQHRAPRALAAASFLIGRLQGETLVRRRLVFPPEVREKVQSLLSSRRP
jgi:HD superfamily phosphohydrolase